MGARSSDGCEMSHDDRLALLEQKDRSKTAWLTVSWVLVIVMIITLAFTVRVMRYQSRKISGLTETVNAHKTMLGTKADQSTVAAMIAIKFDTVMVTAVRAEKVAAAARAGVAAINDDLADIAARFDSENYVTPVALGDFRADMEGRYASFVKAADDSLSAFHAWARGLADQNDLRWSREAVDRNSGDLEIKVRLGRLERWQKLNTGLNLVNLTGFVRHTLGDAHHGK